MGFTSALGHDKVIDSALESEVTREIVALVLDGQSRGNIVLDKIGVRDSRVVETNREGSSLGAFVLHVL